MGALLGVALVAAWLVGRPLAAGLVLALGVPFCVLHVQLRRRGVHSRDCGCIRSSRRGEREVSLAWAAWAVLAAGVAAVLLSGGVVARVDPWTVRALAGAALLAAAVRLWLAGAVGGLAPRPRSFRRCCPQREVIFDAVGRSPRTSVRFDVGWRDCELIVSARVIDAG